MEKALILLVQAVALVIGCHFIHTGIRMLKGEPQLRYNRRVRWDETKSPRTFMVIGGIGVMVAVRLMFI